MKTKSASRNAFFNLRVVVALSVFAVGVFLALFATANPQTLTRERARDVDAQAGGSNETSLAPSGGVQEAWVARYNGPGNDFDAAEAIAVDNSGNVYVTGRSWGSGTGYDYTTIKYNSAGQEKWIARYNGPDNADDYAEGIAVDESGNVYVTGESANAAGFSDYVTIKYSSAGQELWIARYYSRPGNYPDAASAIAIDGSGNAYVTGTSLFYSPASYDYGTIKYNSVGQGQWVARYNGSGNRDDYALAIAVDNSGNIYVTGTSFGSGTDYD